MKIALYVPSWPPGSVPNGIVTYAKYLVPALRQLGHEVFVLTRDPVRADAYTVDLSRFRSWRTTWYRVLFKIFPEMANRKLTGEMLRLAIDELVQKHGIKLLEIEESFGWSHEIAGACRIPVIVRLHGPWFLNKRSSGLSDAKRERWEEQGITSAQAVSSPSSSILDAVASYYKIALGKVACIPNPIECVPAHDAWSVNSCKTNSILFVGRFDEVKGGDLVIEAFAALAQHNQNLHLTFVGTDYGVRLNDGSRASFDEYAESAMPDHVRARLKFLGPVPHSEISALRKSHFLTVCASRSEIFPYSILEAMAYGCPIVTTDVGGIPEMITSYRNGILCRSGHVSELISAIQELIENKDLAETLGKQAWLDCNKNFNAAVVAEQVSAFYRSVVGGLS